MKFGKKDKKPVFHMQTDFVVEHVFDYAGESYFRVQDPLKMPAGRAFATKRYFDQLKSSCSYEYLLAFHHAMKNVTSNPKTIDVTKIYELNKHLGERLEFLYTDDDLLRFASVVYFTNQETPHRYDQAYNNEKIAKWRESGDLLTFFLSEPIVTLIPFLGQLGDFTRTYSDVVNQVQKVQISALLSMLSTEQRSDSYAVSLQQSLERLGNTSTSPEGESSNTSGSSKRDLKALNQRNLDKHKKKNDKP